MRSEVAVEDRPASVRGARWLGIAVCIAAALINLAFNVSATLAYLAISAQGRWLAPGDLMVEWRSLMNAAAAMSLTVIAICTAGIFFVRCRRSVLLLASAALTAGVFGAATQAAAERTVRAWHRSVRAAHAFQTIDACDWRIVEEVAADLNLRAHFVSSNTERWVLLDPFQPYWQEEFRRRLADRCASQPRSAPTPEKR